VHGKDRWEHDLRRLLKAHGRVSADGTRVLSTATLAKRSEVLMAAFRTLREMGYGTSVHGVGSRHIQALCERWKAEGLSASEFATRLSVLRTFANWIKKPGLVDPVARAYRAESRRTLTAREDKSWQGHGVDWHAIKAKLEQVNPRYAVALALQRVFGLRVREALQLRPHVADRGVYLDVNRGTKGGRDRVVKIETPEQRAVLDQAKALTRGLESVGGGELRGKTYEQVRQGYYRALHAVGVARQHGITSHGLRHEYAQEVFERETGARAWVKGQDPRETVEAERLELAKVRVAEDLGHSRGEITRAYLGGPGTRRED
jgi:integrase